MCAFFALMQRHPAPLRQGQPGAGRRRGRPLLPTKVHAVVLVSKLHKPTLRALAYAKATRPNVLEAVYVASDDATTKALVQEWDDRNLGVPLKVLYSPYREIVRPIVEYADPDPEGEPAGRGGGLHPGVRRRPVVGAAAAQPDRAAPEGEAAVHPGRDGDLGAVPAGVLADRPRPRTPRQPSGSRPATCAAGRSAAAGGCRRTSRSTDDRRPVSRRRTRERAPRGASHVGERFEVEVGPVAHGGHCVVRPRRAGGLRPARAAGGAGRGRRSPRAPTATGSGAATPCPCSSASADRVARALPVRRAGALRRLRLPARVCRRPAGAQGGRGPRAAVRGWPVSTLRRARSRRCRPRCAGARGCGTSRCPAAPAGCTSTAPTRWWRSTTA